MSEHGALYWRRQRTETQRTETRRTRVGLPGRAEHRSLRVLRAPSRLRRPLCACLWSFTMAARAASVRDAAIKTGETCAAKLQDGLTKSTETVAQ